MKSNKQHSNNMSEDDEKIKFFINDDENCCTFFPECKLIIQEEPGKSRNPKENNSVKLMKDTFYLPSIFPYIDNKATYKFFRVLNATYRNHLDIIKICKDAKKYKDDLEQNPQIAQTIDFLTEKLLDGKSTSYFDQSAENYEKYKTIKVKSVFDEIMKHFKDFKSFRIHLEKELNDIPRLDEFVNMLKNECEKVDTESKNNRISDSITKKPNIISVYDETFILDRIETVPKQYLNAIVNQMGFDEINLRFFVKISETNLENFAYKNLKINFDKLIDKNEKMKRFIIKLKSCVVQIFLSKKYGEFLKESSSIPFRVVYGEGIFSLEPISDHHDLGDTKSDSDDIGSSVFDEESDSSDDSEEEENDVFEKKDNYSVEEENNNSRKTVYYDKIYNSQKSDYNHKINDSINSNNNNQKFDDSPNSNNNKKFDDSPNSNNDNQKFDDSPNSNNNNQKIDDSPNSNNDAQKVDDLPDSNNDAQKIVDLPDSNNDDQNIVDLPDSNNNDQNIDDLLDSNNDDQKINDSTDSNNDNENCF